MAKNDFERLLAEFRAGWDEHGEATITLKILASPYNEEKDFLVGEVCLPFDTERDHAPGERYATFDGWAVIPKTDYNVAAREEFKRLCGEAGAALPQEWRNLIRGLVPWTMGKPVSWWLAFLVWNERTQEIGPDGKHRGYGLISHPWTASTDAITTFGLHQGETPEQYCKPTGESTDSKIESPVLTQPSKNAFACYRASLTSKGKTQTELAVFLTEELGIPVSQGQVSRWLGWTSGWIKAGNVFPDMPKPARQQTFVTDPAKIDIGERIDHLTPRQHAPKSDDSDD